MALSATLRRFAVPRFIATLYYLIRYRALVSHRAEVEISRNLRFGRKSTVGSFTKIKATDGFLRIGARVDIATGCFIASHVHGIDIGDDALIGPNVSIVGNTYRYDCLDMTFREQGKVSRKGIRIGRNVLIGAGACIVDGAEIGNGVIVAPNAVVASRIPDNAIVQGDPAKTVFQRR